MAASLATIRENLMNHALRATFTAAGFAALAIASAALAIASPSAFADQYAYSNSSRTSDDPPRWYQPVETPRQKYDNAMLEARNALAEALHECSGSRNDRAACQAEARREYQEEVSQAKAHLGSGRRAG
jgi:hypothetical protein